MTTGSLASQPALDDVAYDPGSFRDPGARVFERDGRLFRALSPRAADDFVWLRDRGIIGRLIQAGHLVPTAEISPATIGVDPGDIALVLEHDRVPFVSYPYEWPFSALKAAALFHLDLHLSLLDQDATLADASAYNVQFQTGMRPVFIDVPSLRRYRDGEVWAGHRQFCEQFLNPLLLSARRGIAFNGWYRGAMEGIPHRAARQTSDVARQNVVARPAPHHRTCQAAAVGTVERPGRKCLLAASDATEAVARPPPVRASNVDRRVDASTRRRR